MTLVPLRELLELSDSGVWGDEDTEHGISVLRSTNFNADGTLDLSKITLRALDERDRKRKLLKAGDILLEKSGGGPKQPVGRVCLYRGDTRPHAFGNFIARLRPRNDVLTEYLFYCLWQLHSVGRTCHYQKQTTGIRNLELKRYLSIAVPLRPLDEQRRIVELLARAEGIVRLRREARAKAQAIVPALFLDMFGDPATNPKGWPVAAIGDLASYTRYGPRFHDRNYSDNGAHILRTTDMGYAGELAWQQSPKLAMSAEELERYSLKPGTLLVTRTGATIGKTALFRGATEPCIAGAYLIEVGLSERVVPDVVLHLLLGSYGQAQLSRGTRTVAQPNINAPAICAIRLPVPPLDIQRSFERHVRAVESVLEQQRRAVEAAHAAFNALLSRAFSGDLTAVATATEEAAVA